MEINAIKLSKIRNAFFFEKGSQGSKGSKGTKGSKRDPNEMIMLSSISTFEKREQP